MAIFWKRYVNILPKQYPLMVSVWSTVVLMLCFLMTRGYYLNQNQLNFKNIMGSKKFPVNILANNNKPYLEFLFVKFVPGLSESLQWCHMTLMAPKVTYSFPELQSVLANIKENQSSTLLALCERNPQVTGGFPSQRASDADSVSMSWPHHVN